MSEGNRSVKLNLEKCESISKGFPSSDSKASCIASCEEVFKYFHLVTTRPTGNTTGDLVTTLYLQVFWPSFHLVTRASK